MLCLYRGVIARTVGVAGQPRMYFQSDIQDQDTEQYAPSVTGIIPRLDFAQAVKLLRKGESPSDVMEAAERLGKHELKKQIELYVASGCKKTGVH